MMHGEKLIARINAAKIRKGHCALWWLGQQSFITKLGDTVLYLDPFLTNLKGRRIPPFFNPTEVTNADLILGSHDHTDHIDRAVWPVLAQASPQARFIIPRYYLNALPRELGIPASRFIGLNDRSSVTINGIKVTGIAAAHELLNRDPRTGLYPCLGFVVEGNGFALYHAGDTCNYEGLETRLKKWRFDLVLLPINGRDAKRLKAGCIGNMTYQEAADLAGALKPRLTIPAHYEMFAMNSQDPQAFMDYFQVKYPRLQARLARHGERLTL